MHLPRFQHVRPKSREDAAKLLREHGSAAVLASGGTDVFPRLKYGLARPEIVVSLQGIAPTAPRIGQGGRLELDALMPLAAAARSREVRTRAPILAEAALAVASNQIRHMGTLGGNLCLESRCLYYNQSHTFQFVEPCIKRGGQDLCYFAPKGRRCWAVFAADTVPALLALGATAEIVGAEGRRAVPVEALYTGDPARPIGLGLAEIVAGVAIPAPGKGRGAAFRKLSRRKGLEFAGLTVAAVLETDGGSACDGARVAVGSVAGGPVRAAKAEAVLRGQDLSNREVLREAARAAAMEIRPVAHHGYTAVYLRECLEKETLRALAQAAGQISKIEG